MDDQASPALAQSSAVRAFDELRGEVSLLRRALEGLTSQRDHQRDYGPTLEALVTSNDEVRLWARKVSQQPALQVTPERLAEQIEAAASRFYQLNRGERGLEYARLGEAIARVEAISEQEHTAYEQLRRQKIIGGVCFLSGFMLGPMLAQIAALCSR